MSSSSVTVSQGKVKAPRLMMSLDYIKTRYKSGDDDGLPVDESSAKPAIRMFQSYMDEKYGAQHATESASIKGGLKSRCTQDDFFTTVCVPLSGPVLGFFVFGISH